ncbi:MAG: hypothetical protein MJ233_00280 [Mycoplasmoidaceae bacterium]|nr:hypothetical protein [Mycoplasmoidaceae bacterium]
MGLTSEAAEKKNEYSIIQSPENIKYIFPDAFKEVFVLPTEPEDFKY